MIHTVMSLSIDRAKVIEHSILKCMQPGMSIPEFLSSTFQTVDSLNLNRSERDYAFIFIGAQLEKNNHIHNYEVLFGKKKKPPPEVPS